MDSVAFTICSNNYLGQALALKASFVRQHPNAHFYIVLVDALHDAIDYGEVSPATLLPIAEVPELDVQELSSRYYIIELNTSVKPTLFKHLAKKHPQATAIYYLDPDLYFYRSLDSVSNHLQTKTAVLTPHILSPIPRDGNEPEENTFLRFGIYNLGFCGINPQQEEAKKLLDWWEERVLKYGYDRPNQGYFVDQLWMAHAPLFFDAVEILYGYGYNMAPWNLHERNIEKIDDDGVHLNDGSELVFFHFSKLADNDSDISREYNRFTFKQRPLLKQLYDGYRKELKRCRFEEYRMIPIGFPVRKLPTPKKLSWLGQNIEKIATLFHRLAKKV